jgi:lipid A 4'-phosphatase
MWIALGFALGLGIGLVRIAQGGHFLSDVLFSGWIVYGTALALRALIFRHWRTRPRPAPG